MQANEGAFDSARAELAKTIHWRVEDDRIVAAFATVPREEFLPPYLADAAYQDTALPIGEGQTISQPTIVAMMAEAAALTGTERVL
jgi:protein-L-isoaspartate(D-aspartate) O-methyltransferase